VTNACNLGHIINLATKLRFNIKCSDVGLYVLLIRMLFNDFCTGSSSSTEFLGVWEGLGILILVIALLLVIGFLIALCLVNILTAKIMILLTLT